MAYQSKITFHTLQIGGHEDSIEIDEVLIQDSMSSKMNGMR